MEQKNEKRCVMCGFPLAEDPEEDPYNLTVVHEDSIWICLECFLTKTEPLKRLTEQSREFQKWIQQIQRKKEEKLLKRVTA